MNLFPRLSTCYYLIVHPRPSPSVTVFLGTPFLYFLIRYRSITTEEWRSGIEFLTLMGETSITRGRQFTQFSDVFGVTALVERINNPRVGNATESTLLGPFFTEDAPDRAYIDPSIPQPRKSSPLRLRLHLS